MLADLGTPGNDATPRSMPLEPMTGPTAGPMFGGRSLPGVPSWIGLWLKG
ncbi:MAG: hypothetical protein V3T83_08975 [Acidobacteriota bacterium]